jgi:hypothetical protein
MFFEPQGSPRTDVMIAAAVQWAERIMTKIDSTFVKAKTSLYFGEISG